MTAHDRVITSLCPGSGGQNDVAIKPLKQPLAEGEPIWLHVHTFLHGN